MACAISVFPASEFSEDSLMMAARNGNCTEVKRLLDTAGWMSASAKDDALCVAALRGHADIVETMLQAGADVHVLDGESLQFATMRKRASVARVLRAWIDQEEAQRCSPEGCQHLR